MPMSTVLSLAVASARGTATILFPCSAALLPTPPPRDVAEHDVPRFEFRPLLDRLRQDLGDPAQPDVAELVLLRFLENELPAGARHRSELRPLRDHDDGKRLSPAMAPPDQVAHFFKVDRDLGNGNNVRSAGAP